MNAYKDPELCDYKNDGVRNETFLFRNASVQKDSTQSSTPIERLPQQVNACKDPELCDYKNDGVRNETFLFRNASVQKDSAQSSTPMERLPQQVNACKDSELCDHKNDGVRNDWFRKHFCSEMLQFRETLHRTLLLSTECRGSSEVPS